MAPMSAAPPAGVFRNFERPLVTLGAPEPPNPALGDTALRAPFVTGVFTVGANGAPTPGAPGVGGAGRLALPADAIAPPPGVGGSPLGAPGARETPAASAVPPGAPLPANDCPSTVLGDEIREGALP